MLNKKVYKAIVTSIQNREVKILGILSRKLLLTIATNDLREKDFPESKVLKMLVLDQYKPIEFSDQLQ